MDVLQAPWRIAYILAPKGPRGPESPSLFAEIGRSSDDVAHHVVARASTCYAVLNTFPYAAGHLMTVPYRQVAALEDLTPEEALDLMLLTQRCVVALRKVMRPHGFNVGLNLGKCAGAGIVEHLHLHVVPRWEGDTNFMPVLGSTGVLPEALHETAAKIRAELARSPSAQPAASRDL